MTLFKINHIPLRNTFTVQETVVAHVLFLKSAAIFMHEIRKYHMKILQNMVTEGKVKKFCHLKSDKTVIVPHKYESYVWSVFYSNTWFSVDYVMKIRTISLKMWRAHSATLKTSAGIKINEKNSYFSIKYQKRNRSSSNSLCSLPAVDKAKWNDFYESDIK